MSQAFVDAPFAAGLRDDRQYRILVEAVTDYAIYMLDPEGVIASWNAGAERFNGYSAVEIVGRHFQIFYTLEDQANGVPGRALQTAADVGRFESEGWRVRKDGHRFRASVVIHPIRDSGRLIGFAKITRDITERWEAEQALVLSNAALLQSQKMEAIGQLTGGLAHDFNNILTAVLSSLELLGRRLPEDANVQRLLDNALAAARLGTGLTQRLLAFARKQDLASAAVDLCDLVRGMDGLLRSSLGRRVTLEARIPPKASLIVVEANQLEMALLNLAVNARDAMTDGGSVVITIREAWVSDGELQGLPAGSYACLALQDNGVGMNETTLSRATEPFYSTKGPGLGTGLGLSMIHGMAIQAGGALVIRSKPGNGTTVELWFPLAKTSLEASVGISPSAEV